MHFVNQVDLEARSGWCVLYVVQQLSRVFDLGARCGVNLRHIDTATLGNLDATGADTAWGCSNALLAVETLCDESRYVVLPTPRVPVKVSMMQSL